MEKAIISAFIKRITYKRSISCAVSVNHHEFKITQKCFNLCRICKQNVLFQNGVCQWWNVLPQYAL